MVKVKHIIPGLLPLLLQALGAVKLNRKKSAASGYPDPVGFKSWEFMEKFALTCR